MALQKDEKKQSYHLLVKWVYHRHSYMQDNEDVDLSLLIQRFTAMMGLELSPHVMKYKNGDELTLQRSDIISLKSRVSHMGIIDYAEALTIYMRIGNKELDLSDQAKVQRELKELKEADQKLSRSTRLNSITEAKVRQPCSSNLTFLVVLLLGCNLVFNCYSSKISSGPTPALKRGKGCSTQHFDTYRRRRNWGRCL